jgi:hypothetical protein
MRASILTLAPGFSSSAKVLPQPAPAVCNPSYRHAICLPSGGAGRNHTPEPAFPGIGGQWRREMARDHGSQIKDDDQYEALRRQGASKETAARIANTGCSKAGKRGGRSPRYEYWSKDDLYQRAREIGIDGRSGMSKRELIQALRHH